MNPVDYPVRMYCPLTYAEEIVYFHPIEHNGKLLVHIDSFNGCDRNWHACAECEACKKNAYEKVKESTK